VSPLHPFIARNRVFERPAVVAALHISVRGLLSLPVRRAVASSTPRWAAHNGRPARLRSFLRSNHLEGDVIPLLVVWGPGSRHGSADPRWVDGAGLLVGKHAAEWLPRLDASAREARGDREAVDVLTVFVEQRGRQTLSAAKPGVLARA